MYWAAMTAGSGWSSGSDSIANEWWGVQASAMVLQVQVGKDRNSRQSRSISQTASIKDPLHLHLLWSVPAASWSFPTPAVAPCGLLGQARVKSRLESMSLFQKVLEHFTSL